MGQMGMGGKLQLCVREGKVMRRLFSFVAALGRSVCRFLGWLLYLMATV